MRHTSYPPNLPSVYSVIPLIIWPSHLHIFNHWMIPCVIYIFYQLHNKLSSQFNTPKLEDLPPFGWVVCVSFIHVCQSVLFTHPEHMKHFSSIICSYKSIFPPHIGCLKVLNKLSYLRDKTVAAVHKPTQVNFTLITPGLYIYNYCTYWKGFIRIIISSWLPSSFLWGSHCKVSLTMVSTHWL